MHEVLVNRLGGLSLHRKSVVRLTDRPDMTLDVYCGRKTTNQQINKSFSRCNNDAPLHPWHWKRYLDLGINVTLFPDERHVLDIHTSGMKRNKMDNY